MFPALIFASVLAFAGTGPDQDAKPADGKGAASICEQAPSECRMVPTFSLRIGDKAFPVTFDKPQPWIMEGRLYIFPGESVVLVLKPDGGIRVTSSQPAEAVIDDAVAAKMIAVFAPGGSGENATEADVIPGTTDLRQDAPSQAIRVSFRQAAHSDQMVLAVQNGYGGRLAYDAGMLTPSGDGGVWRETSVCTLRPDLYGMEHWPHAIVSLSLGAFTIDRTAPADEIICR